MAVQTIQTVSRSGLNLDTVAVAASAGGDKWAGSGAEFLYVNNASGGAITATFPIGFTVDGQTMAFRVVSVPAGNHMLIGPLPSLYNDGNGNVNVSWSAVTSVTISVVRLGQ